MTDQQEPKENQDEPTKDVSVDDQQSQQANEQNAADWDYVDADRDTDADVPTARGLDESTTAATWSALEYQHHPKGALWFVLITIAAIIGAGLTYIVTKDVVSAAVIVIVLALLAVNSARHPRMLECSVDGTGIHVGPKSYAYDHFKAFTVTAEGELSTIMLLPLKRFRPMLAILFPSDRQDIVEVLQSHVPFQATISDPIDSLTKRLHF